MLMMEAIYDNTSAGGSRRKLLKVLLLSRLSHTLHSKIVRRKPSKYTYSFFKVEGEEEEEEEEVFRPVII